MKFSVFQFLQHQEESGSVSATPTIRCWYKLVRNPCSLLFSKLKTWRNLSSLSLPISQILLSLNHLCGPSLFPLGCSCPCTGCPGGDTALQIHLPDAVQKGIITCLSLLAMLLLMQPRMLLVSLMQRHKADWCSVCHLPRSFCEASAFWVPLACMDFVCKSAYLIPGTQIHVGHQNKSRLLFQGTAHLQLPMEKRGSVMIKALFHVSRLPVAEPSSSNCVQTVSVRCYISTKL